MASTPASQREEHMLHIGKQCADPLCHLVDFLPFKCTHCSESFCQEHYRVEAHKCPDYDESKFNRVAPDCPFCFTPIAVPPGQDPNIRLEAHFEKECSVLTGKDGKAKSAPTCARATCKKVLFSPIKCDSCHQQFCPSHRFPSDHTCKPTASPSSSRPSPSQAAASAAARRQAAQANLGKATKSVNAQASKAAANVKNLNAKAGAAVASAAQAASASTTKVLKTDRVSFLSFNVPPAAPGDASTTSTTTTTTPIFNFDVQSRAKAERASQLKAMRARDAKGLLNASEKVVLAQLEVDSKADKDCVIM